MFICTYRTALLKDVLIRLSNGIFSRVVISLAIEVFMLNPKRPTTYSDKMQACSTQTVLEKIPSET